MSYERQYYTNGDVLDARQMNHMETGIKENSDNVGKLSKDIATKASAIKEKASGEVIVVTDSDEAKPLGLAIDGKSEQNQYSGNQLYDVDDKTSSWPNAVVDDEGWITASYDNTDGTATKYLTTNVKPSDLIEPSKEYLVVVELKSNNLKSIEICSDGADGKGQFESLFLLQGLTMGIKVQKVTSREDFTDCITMLRTVLHVPAGVNGSATYRISVLKDISVTADTFVYEPFVGGKPSPSTEYEQKIRNIGVYDEASGKYAVEVKCTKKNKLNCSGLVESVSNGITLTPVYDENGLLEYIETNGTATGKIDITIQPNVKLPLGSYVLNGCPNNGDSKSYRLMFVIKGTNGEVYDADYGNGKEIIIGNDFINMRCSVRITTGCTVNKLRFYPMIRPVGTDSTYEPYKETTATVLLDEPLRKGDKAYWNGEKLLVERNRAILTLDGSEEYTHTDGWSNENALVTNSVLPWNPKLISGYDTKADILCEKLIVTTPADLSTTTKKENIMGQSGKRLYFDISGVSSREEMKSYLAENPITVEYTLAEQITEEIDLSLDGLSMFYPTTILSNDCNANMEVEYIADTKAYIDKKFAELATAMV